MINAYLPLDQPQNEMQLKQLIENVLATVTYATRASVSRALNTSPGNLVFNRDMFVDVPLISNLAAIRDRRQQRTRTPRYRREMRWSIICSVAVLPATYSEPYVAVSTVPCFRV